MRTHSQIISDAGGPKGLAERLTNAGHPFTPDQTRFWALRKTIPPERWPAVAEAGIASTDELASAFAAKKLGGETAQQEAAA